MRTLNTPEPMWGVSAEADFEKNTWTFKMVGGDWTVSAGAYAIIPDGDYQELLKMRQRAEKAEHELDAVDTVLAHRAALDRIPDRVDKIMHAIMAAKATS